MSWKYAGVGVFLVFLSCFCMSYCQDVKDINSLKGMMKKKEKCEQQKTQLIKKISRADKISKDEAEQSEKFQNSFPEECKELEAFSFKSMTVNEVLQLVFASEEDPQTVYGIAKEIELNVLKQLMYSASGMGWGLVLKTYFSRVHKKQVPLDKWCNLVEKEKDILVTLM